MYIFQRKVMKIESPNPTERKKDALVNEIKKKRKEKKKTPLPQKNRERGQL